MAETTAIAPFEARARYAECDAWGELHPMAWASLFDSALADALGQRGIALHELRHPSAALRVSAVKLEIHRPLRFDEGVTITVVASHINLQGWVVELQAHDGRDPDALASCQLGHSWRREADAGALSGLQAALAA